jgi:hypothetical protein
LAVRGGRTSQPPGKQNYRKRNMEDTKAIVALIVLILTLLVGIWMDNHLPGFNPVETRMHP